MEEHPPKKPSTISDEEPQVHGEPERIPVSNADEGKDNLPTIQDEPRQPSDRETTIQGEREVIGNFIRQRSGESVGKDSEPIRDDKTEVSLAKQNQPETLPTSTQLQKAEDVHATTKSDLSALANIELSSFPISEQPSPQNAAEQKSADDLTPKEVVEAAIEHGLLEFNETIIEDFNSQDGDKDLLGHKTNPDDNDAEPVAINKKSILDKDNSDSSVNKNSLNTHNVVSTISQEAEVDEEKPLLEPSIFYEIGISKDKKSQAEKPASKYVFCFS